MELKIGRPENLSLCYTENPQESNIIRCWLTYTGNNEVTLVANHKGACYYILSLTERGIYRRSGARVSNLPIACINGRVADITLEKEQ